MRLHQDGGGSAHEHDERGGGISPGKRTLTQGLAPVQRQDATAAPADAAAAPRSEARGEDPFAMHLIGDRGGAGGMPANVQARMEASFGYDLSPVRVHQDGAADAMDAHAFAEGTDLHFGAGEYAPERPEGLHLLAHELAHVTQQAMGRAPAGLHAKLNGMLVDDPLEHEADDMADRAVRGEPAWAGAGTGPLRALPSMASSPIMPKLKVARNWIKVAQTVADRVTEHGGDAEIVAILQQWAADGRKKGRSFGSWALAIAAARAELDEGNDELDQEDDLDDDHDPDGGGGPPDGDGGGGGCAGWWSRRSRLSKLLMLLFLLLLVVGGPMVAMLAMGMGNYEVRPGMPNTAMTARRELEPLMNAGTRVQMTDLAANSLVESLREQVRPLPFADVLDGRPDLEEMIPDLGRLRNLERELDLLAPQLEALGPALQQVQPVLEQLGPNDLDNPPNAGVYHEHIFFGPQPTATPVPPNPLAQGQAQSPVRPTDLGFFHDGVHPDRPDMLGTYTAPQHHYDRDLMERAALDVARNYEHYRGITHNCQDYVDAVVAHYKELGGREVVPTSRSAATLAITDYLISWGGRLLDAKVEEAIGEKLSALPSSADGGSACAQAVAEQLGISADTFGGAVDLVLDQVMDFPVIGRKPLRTALCGQTGNDLIDSGLSRMSALLDEPVDLPEEGHSSVRAALCTPKNARGDNALKGVLFELVRTQGGDEILANMPAFIRNDALARNKLATDLTRRLANHLYEILNLRGVCG